MRRCVGTRLGIESLRQHRGSRRTRVGHCCPPDSNLALPCHNPPVTGLRVSAAPERIASMTMAPAAAAVSGAAEPGEAGSSLALRPRWRGGRAGAAEARGAGGRPAPGATQPRTDAGGEGRGGPREWRRGRGAGGRRRLQPPHRDPGGCARSRGPTWPRRPLRAAPRRVCDPRREGLGVYRPCTTG